MNSLTFKKRTLIPFFIIILLCFNVGDLSDQILRLGLKIGDGTEVPINIIDTDSIGLSDMACLDSLSNTLEILIVNTSVNDGYIYAASISTSSGNVLNDVSITQLGGGSASALILFTFNEVWDSTEVFEIIIGYAEAIDPSIGGKPFRHHILRYEFSMDLCEDSTNGYDLATEGNEELRTSIVTDMKLSPNPTTGEFQLHYSLKESSNVEILIYNSIGEKVQTLVNRKYQEAGDYQVIESLSLDLGSGLYYIVSNVGGKITTNKLVKL